MVSMRLYYQKLGGHIHCRLFTAPHPSHTHAKCGDLVFSEDEWTDVRVSFECGGVDVLEERHATPAEG